MNNIIKGDNNMNINPLIHGENGFKPINKLPKEDMKFRIKFAVSRVAKDMTSKAEGFLTAENFEEQAEEIKRWLDESCIGAAILEVEEL